MRNSCSQQQKKDLSVYDFDAEDLAVESAPEKYKWKQKSSAEEEKDEVDKYRFLQAFTSGLNCEQMNANGMLCIDLHENSSLEGSNAIDSPKRKLAHTDKNSELDENMASSTSYEEHDNACLSEVDPETLVREDPLMTGASGHVVPSVGTDQVSNQQSDGTPVDVISDAEESCTPCSVSPSISASDIADDEDYMEHPFSETCYTAVGEKDNNDSAVVVSPDYVIYENILHTEAQFFFFSDSIVVKCSEASGNNDNIVLEWAISDIIRIECRWSESVGATLVKFQRATTVNRNENVHDTYAVELTFAVTDMHWLEKELNIKRLSERYKGIWNVPRYGHSTLEDDMERNMFFPRHYFTEIPDSFEDVIYPKGDPDAVSISKRDIELLQPDTFINDTIIDFYIKYLKTKIPAHLRHRFHFFNSFFFRKLADLDKDPGSASEGRAAFLRVRKWTRKVNIFEKDCIFIPVNFNLHWSLLVICHPGEVAVLKEDGSKRSSKVPCILHMDSIKGSHSGLKNLVQSYLLEEWKERHPDSAEDYASIFSNLRFVPLEVPQQDNSFDCGLFLLHYVELFLEEAPVNFSPFRISKFSSFLTADWFIPSDASFKRSHIRKLIYELLNDDPSQNVASTSCNNTHFPSAYHDHIIEQKPVEFLNQQCSPSKPILDNPTCSITVRGIEMNLDTTSPPGAAKCNKQEQLVMHEFLEPGANSLSLFQEDAPVQIPKSATCPTEVLADKNEQLYTSSLNKDDCQPVGENSLTKPCAASNGLNDFEVVHTAQSSMLEKEDIGLTLLPKNSNHVISNENNVTGKEASVSIEDCGYVPDSQTLTSGENQENVSQDPRENSQGIEATTEKDGHENANCEQTNTAEDKPKIAITVDHEINTCKAEAKTSEDCLVADTVTVNVIDDEKVKDFQESVHVEDSEDTITVLDETSSVKDGSRLKRRGPSTRAEPFYQKRRKVPQPYGERRRTRSFARDCP